MKSDTRALIDVAELVKLLAANGRLIRRRRQLRGLPRPMSPNAPLRWLRRDIDAWLSEPSGSPRRHAGGA